MTLAPRFSLLPLSCLALVAPALAADVEVELDAGSGFVIQNNGASVERFRVDEATGNVSRNGALFVHTTGTNNTFVGQEAGNTSTTGVGANSAFGVRTLTSNAVGYFNSAFGYEALTSNTSGVGNDAFGWRALEHNTTGFANLALGNQALRYNTTGFFNVGVGGGALRQNTEGRWNVAFGTNALRGNVYGRSNSAFGTSALYGNLVSYNSAFGGGALASNTTACCNSGFGHLALNGNTTGTFNAAFGKDALSSNVSGSGNSAFGSNALRASISDGNSAFGADALYSNTATGGNSAFGRNALFSNNGSVNAAFGVDALRLNTTGSVNAAFGSYALENNTTGSGNIAVGKDAGRGQTTGNNNIYIANLGVATESGQIKIGTAGTHTDAFIAGDLVTGGTLGVAGSADRDGTVHDADGNGDAHLNFKATGQELLIGVSNSGAGLVSMQTAQALQFRTGATARLTLLDTGEVRSQAIRDHTLGGTTTAVHIDTSSGVLGVLASSVRFKQEIEDLGSTSEVVSALRPVAFRYREEAGGDGRTREYGLIAEEVAGVAPELVLYDDAGQPYSVRYHLLAPMLLNEVQEQQRTDEALRAVMEEQQQLIAALEERLEALEGKATPAR